METHVVTADKNLWGNGEDRERMSTKSSFLCTSALCCAMSVLAESALFPWWRQPEQARCPCWSLAVVCPEREHVCNNWNPTFHPIVNVNMSLPPGHMQEVGMQISWTSHVSPWKQILPWPLQQKRLLKKMSCQGNVHLKAIMLLWIKIPDAKQMSISSTKKTDALFWVSTTAWHVKGRKPSQNMLEATVELRRQLLDSCSERPT